MKLLAPVFVLFLLLTCFFVSTNGNFFHDFLNPRLRHTPQFQGSQLYQVDVGLDGVPGSIGCFGDFNSDKYTDLFVINENKTLIEVYLWNTDTWKFYGSSARIELPNITNIAASDFNHDGKLDLLVMGDHQREINGTFVTTTYLKLYFGDLTALTLAPEHIPDANDQVLIFDQDNNLLPDLFGEVPGDLINPPRRAFWINQDNGAFKIVFQESSTGAPLAPLAKPHSNGFADFNGDCLSDLFVTSMNGDVKQYEIWINRKQDGYQLRNVVPLPSGTGQITFGDFDGDGTLDLCVPVCYPTSTCASENSVRIVYNTQKPLCPFFSSKNAVCRKATALCSADDSFVLSNVSLPVPDVSAMAVGGISTGAFGSTKFAFNDGNPLTIRIGDYNLDGYTDLIIPVRDAVTNATRMDLWYNSPAGANKRGFSLQSDGVAQLTSITGAYAAGFFDLDENGSLDMLVLKDNPPRIQAIFNNFQNDAFFLKAVGLNGVCTAWCSGSTSFPDPKPYGVNFRGGMFKFTITDLNGQTHLAIGAQLSQSAYLSLNTPYILFGLGRTSNYIEQFFYGVPLNNPVHYQFWTGSTIPNSQVVAIPYKPADPTGWTLELYANPSGVMFWVIIAVLVSVIILTTAIYILYRREKQEDEKHKQEIAHLFSFDAL